MPDELVLLEKIERYHTGVMEPAERLQWEQSMETDEELRAEVLAYAPVFGAWQALRNEQFRQTMGQWEAEWQEIEESEAIENWLKGQSGYDWVAQKIQTEPSFEAKVNQHKQLLEGFSAARGQDFHSAMQGWEQQDKTNATTTKGAVVRPLWRRWAVAAAITPLLIVAAVAYWYANSQYNNEALVDHFYQQPSIGNTLSGQAATADELTKAFNTAHDHLYNHRYAQAAELFQYVKGMATTAQMDELSKQYFVQNAEWSMALAQLGDDRTADAEAILKDIIQNNNHAYHQQAVELESSLHSLFRKLTK